MRKMLTLVAAIAFPVLLASTAHAAYPPNEPTIEVGSSSVVPGDPQTVSVQNFCPGETVTFTLNPGGVALGTDVADADGTASVTFDAPATAGTYSVVATAAGECGQGGPLTATVSFTVNSLPPLPVTGSDSMSTVYWAALAVGVGVILAVVALRRRRHAIA
ncbi:MAG: LPXTG cell wall anchor domain-containing protein [Ilumatobacteraceae bacterium]